MRVAGIIRDSLVNGKGLRDVVFLQGCPHHCKGCHNPETWAYNNGKDISEEQLAKMFEDSPNDITISGGEPFLQWGEVMQFMKYVCEKNPNKRFWIYTGYLYELISWIVEGCMQPYVTVVVDGKYKEDEKDQNCLYRGSRNQRLIDVHKTIENNRVTLWEENYETQS